jgi:hypothetical protein
MEPGAWGELHQKLHGDLHRDCGELAEQDAHRDYHKGQCHVLNEMLRQLFTL